MWSIRARLLIESKEEKKAKRFGNLDILDDHLVQTFRKRWFHWSFEKKAVQLMRQV